MAEKKKAEPKLDLAEKYKMAHKTLTEIANKPWGAATRLAKERLKELGPNS